MSTRLTSAEKQHLLHQFANDHYPVSSWGRLSPQQQTALEPFVRDRVVVDFGCGPELHLATRMICDLGARAVLAVDKAPLTAKALLAPDTTKLLKDRKIWFLKANFYPEDHTDIFRDIAVLSALHGKAPPVALVSWPINNPSSTALLPLLRPMSHVAYLGCTTAGMSCGTPEFFTAMLSRALCAYVPEPKNSLIVYGSPCPERRPVPCEWAGIDQSVMYPFHTTKEGAMP